MPQKGYLTNKKALPRVKEPKEEEELSEDGAESSSENELDQDTNEILNKTIANETFSLYVRSAAWLKDRDNAINLLREIEPRIQNVRHPRQKHADYCFIDFTSANERDEAYEVLKKHPKLTVKPVTKDVPSKLAKRKQKITEKREAKNESRRLLAKIKKNEKQQANDEKTNQLIISNVPKQITVAELKEQYPNSVKIAIKSKKPGMTTAIISYPSPHDAIAASREPIVLHGHKLKAFLNTSASFKNNLKMKRKRKGNAKQSNTEPVTKAAKVEAN